MRELIPKIPNITAIQNQRNIDQAGSHSELILPQHSASSSALQQVAPAAPATQSKHGSDKNRGSPS